MVRQWRRIAWSLTTVVLAGALAGVASAQGSYERAVALEKQGRFSEAASTLATATLSKRKQAHADALVAALRAMGAASRYRRAGQPDQALKALDDALANVDPVRDVYVRSELVRRRNAVTADASRAADLEAQAWLDRATELEREKRYDDAAEAYGAVVGAEDSGISAQQMRKARLGKLAAEREADIAEDDVAFEDEAGSWIAGKGALLVGWVDAALPFFLVLGLVGIVAAIPRLRGPERNRTAIALTDWSAEPAERAQKSLALGRQLKAEIDALARSASGSAVEIDETRDLQGSPIAGLRPPGDEISNLEALIPADTPFKVGPVSFSLTQVVALARAPFSRRPERELVGSLTCEGEKTILSAQIVGNPRQPDFGPWLASYSGQGSRERAVSDLATQIAVEVGESHVSPDWRSVRDYRAATAMLAADGDDDSKTRFTNAAMLLRRALEFDPNNLLARFYLANVERSLGNNSLAVRQLDFLESLVARADTAASPARSRFLTNHPEFALLARYNQAVALAKIGDWNCHNRALDILEALPAQITDIRERIPNEDGAHRLFDRLLMLVASAEAAARVFELEQWRGRRGDERLAKRRNDVFARVEAIRDDLQKRPAAADPRESIAYAQALATAENAYGRAVYITGGASDVAVGALESAVALQPNLGDAWVNLASVLMEARAANWKTRAEESLAHALALAPENEKARYLLGILYEELTLYDKAREEFAKIDGDFRACMKLAQLAERDKNWAHAAAYMERSLELRERLDYRVEAYVRYLIELGKTDPSQLKTAKQWAKRLAEKGVQERFRREGKELLGRIADLEP